jgi:hypothetical protein
MRDAVAHRVEIDRRIIGDAPSEPLLATGQCPDRQRPQGRPRVPLEARTVRFVRGEGTLNTFTRDIVRGALLSAADADKILVVPAKANSSRARGLI